MFNQLDGLTPKYQKPANLSFRKIHCNKQSLSISGSLLGVVLVLLGGWALSGDIFECPNSELQPVVVLGIWWVEPGVLLNIYKEQDLTHDKNYLAQNFSSAKG